MIEITNNKQLLLLYNISFHELCLKPFFLFQGKESLLRPLVCGMLRSKYIIQM